MGETWIGPCERLIVSLLHFAEAAEAHNWGLEPQRRDQAGGLTTKVDLYSRGKVGDLAKQNGLGRQGG